MTTVSPTIVNVNISCMQQIHGYNPKVFFVDDNVYFSAKYASINYMHLLNKMYMNMLYSQENDRDGK